MNKHELKQEVIKTMVWGLYQADSDNAIIFTMQFYTFCKMLNILSFEDVSKLAVTVEALQEKSGLYNRRPGLNTRKEQHDNYVALILAGEFIPQSQIAQEIEKYGQKHFYCYNNIPPYNFKFD